MTDVIAHDNYHFHQYVIISCVFNHACHGALVVSLEHINCEVGTKLYVWNKVIRVIINFQRPFELNAVSYTFIFDRQSLDYF